MRNENRKKARIKYSTQAMVRSAGKGSVGGIIRDIGMESLYINLEPIFEMNEMVEIEITLYGQDSLMSIRANGSVIRTDQNGAAFGFTSPLEWWPVFSLFPMHGIDDDLTV